MPATICRLKKMYMISGGIVMSRTFVNSRFHGAHRLGLVVEHGQLHRRVLVAGQEVQRDREVVEHGHGLHDDHGDDHRLQQREDHAEEQLDGPGAVDDRRLVELARDRGDERPEQQDAERQAEGDVHGDEADQRLEEAEALQHPDRGDDGGRHDEPREHEHVDQGGSSATCGAAARTRPSAPSTTMIETEATVRIVLLTKARTSRKSRFSNTVTMLSKNAHSVGQLKSRNDASAWVFAGREHDERERHDEDQDGDEDARRCRRPTARRRFFIGRPPSG